MKKLLKITAGILLCCTLCIMSACISSQDGGEESLGVVVSIPPYGEWAEKIGGEHVDVTVLIPEGSSPHTYEPTPNQMVDVSKAELWIKNGAGLEFWADKIVQTNKSIMTIDISEMAALIEIDGSYDPHVWLSTETARNATYEIYRALSTIDPENESYYQANYAAYINDIDAINTQIMAILDEKESRTFLVMHPAFSYFARDYGLTQIALEESGKEPGPERITTIIEDAKELGITTIFVEPQFSAQEAEIVAKEIGGSVVAINPLAHDYLDNLITIAESLEEGLV